MRTNTVRQRLRAGQPTYGCFVGLGSPNVAELLAQVGFDWLVIETEHNGLDAREVEQMLMAVGNSEAIPIVRVPSAQPVFIQRALDLGALGVLVPMVRTAAEAAAIVQATRFPPQGQRSYGPLRATRYTVDTDDYLARANDNILVALIIETREAVAALDEIAAVPGVDALVLGPFDLGLAYGQDPRAGYSPPVLAAIERMLQVGRRHGVACGIGETSVEALARWRERGFTLLSYGADYSLLVAIAGGGLVRLRSGEAEAVAAGPGSDR